jgi:hypothetical protein
MPDLSSAYLTGAALLKRLAGSLIDGAARSSSLVTLAVYLEASAATSISWTDKFRVV